MSVDRPTNERMRVSGPCHVFTMLFASRRAERVGLGRAERVEGQQSPGETSAIQGRPYHLSEIACPVLVLSGCTFITDLVIPPNDLVILPIQRRYVSSRLVLVIASGGVG